MRLLPVMDLLQGTVVRGIAGQRDRYEPWISPLTGSSDPLSIARALADRCGHRDLYVADLDGIIHSRPNWRIHAELQAAGFGLWLDGGPEVWEAWPTGKLNLAAVRPIIGLESCPSPAELRSILTSITGERCAFSLDLKQTLPLASPEWPSNPMAIAEIVVSAGINSLIVLDLGDVGMSTGGSTRCLCQQIRERFPELRLIAGGGLRHREDVQNWLGCADELLVASALHHGQISFQDVMLLADANS